MHQFEAEREGRVELEILLKYRRRVSIPHKVVRVGGSQGDRLVATVLVGIEGRGPVGTLVDLQGARRTFRALEGGEVGHCSEVRATDDGVDMARGYPRVNDGIESSGLEGRVGLFGRARDHRLY